MNITKENINELNATISVKIEKADYESSVNDVIKDYRKKANIPGFRPGKVPTGLIRKMYGKAILADEVNKLLSQSLSNYIVEEKLNILGEPLPNEEKQAEFDWDKDENFEFIFDLALAPEIQVKLDKRNKFPYYNIDIDEEMIDRQAESYTSRFGENFPAETFEEKETIRGNFVQLNSEDNELEAGIKAENIAVAVDTMKDDETKKLFVGKKVGDTVVFDPIKAFDNRHEVGHLLNVSHEEAENIQGNFSFTITEILHFQPAELNEKLFQQIYGEDTAVKTVESFREKLKKELEGNFVYSSEYKFSQDIRAALLDKITMELPEEFLKRWLKATSKDLTEEQIDSDFENFMKDLRWQLVKNQLIRDNEIKIEQEDYKAAAKEMALMQFRQYGMNDVPEEHLENFANQILQNEEERRRIETKTQEDKIVELIKSKVTLDEKSISFEEFNKLLEK